MTHSVHPYAHRLGIIRDWRSRWFGRRGRYQEFLKADVLLREFLEKKLKNFFVNSIEIERGANTLRVIVKTARPGMVIGRNGEGSIKLKAEIIALLKRLGAEIPPEFRLDVEEVKNPEAQAAVAAKLVIEGLEKRFPFKRVMRQVLEKIMANRQVEGARINLAGRLGGADIARSESLKRGRLPLQTLRADIDYARDEAHLSYGVIGIKVWIYKGQIFE